MDDPLAAILITVLTLVPGVYLGWTAIKVYGLFRYRGTNSIEEEFWSRNG